MSLTGAALGGDGNIVMQMGMQYGEKVFAESEKNVSRWFSMVDLKRYFRVDNRYVKAKVGLVLFPYTRPFTRTRFDYSDDSKGSTEYLPPSDDVFAPDLYIPMMGIITYVILSAFVKGMRNVHVSPNDLATTCSSVLFWLALEVGAFKGWRYAVGVGQNITVWDIASLCGYKYVGICLLVLARALIPFESVAWTVGVLVFAASMATFMFKSLSDLLSRGERLSPKCVPVVYAMAAVQIPFYMWFFHRAL